MSLQAKAIRPNAGPRWSRKRLIDMLLDCYGATNRNTVDAAAVAAYAGVTPSTVRRWISKRHPPSRRMAIPKHRIAQLQRGPADVERRNDQQYRYALNALASIEDESAILPPWREQVFIALSHLALSATEFFRLPPDRVVELGSQVEM